MRHENEKEIVDRYTLEELILRLENIRFSLESHLNLPKALYSLALEIKKLKKE
jgi:hypothetical protein